MRADLIENCLHLCTDYERLEHQLDELDAALTNLENRRDQLHEEALQLLQEAREVRSANKQEQEQQQSETPRD